MINWKSPITIAIILILIVIAAAMIGSSQWLKNLFNPKPKDGTACPLGNETGTWINGVCTAGSPPPPPPNPDEEARMIQAPDRLNIIKRGACLSRIKLSQYPGVVYQLTGSNKIFCFYKKA